VFGYEEAKFVLMREDLFGHPIYLMRGASEANGGPRGVLLLQGEEHAAVHRYLLSHFSPRMVRSYRDRLIRPLTRRLLDAILPSGRVDLSEDLAGKLPSNVISGILGLPWQDEELLDSCRVWNSTIFRWSETFGEDDEAMSVAHDAAANLNAVLLPVIRERQETRRDDLISTLWDYGPKILHPWGEEEVLAQCRALFFAGSDTTAHLLRNAVFVLANEPALQERLRGDAARIELFVDEVLRLYAPVHFRIRVSNEDVRIGEQLVKKGDRLHPMNAAANRDPRHYTDPDDVDIDRQPLRDHLAFSAGPRFCVGAALARGEACEVIEQLLALVKSMTWDRSAAAARLTGYMPRSFRPLNVLIDASVPVRESVQ
jgi:cytochrome P450